MHSSFLAPSVERQYHTQVEIEALLWEFCKFSYLHLYGICISFYKQNSGKKFFFMFTLMVHCEKCIQSCIEVDICADTKMYSSMVALYMAAQWFNLLAVHVAVEFLYWLLVWWSTIRVNVIYVDVCQVSFVQYSHAHTALHTSSSTFSWDVSHCLITFFYCNLILHLVAGP